MPVADIHPEHLIDKLKREGLSGKESSHLLAHLRVCSVCRLEIELWRDYEQQSVQGPLSPRRSRGRSVMRRTRGSVMRRARGSPSVPRLRRPVVGVVLLAAASTGAAAALRICSMAHQPPPLASDVSVPPLTASPDPSPRRMYQPAGAQGSDARQPPRPSARPTAHRLPVPRGRALRQATVRRALSGEPASAESAHALFVRGNHARRQGDAERATRLYRELDQRFPSSLEASVARLTAALLYLDRGDPAGALRAFHRYLSRPVGGLEAEALVGSATALSRLGRRSEEAATWVRVAHAYPDSAYARQAQQRLRSLRVR